jgi:pimeloyl-ACP methyl ester carboxylesterase
MKSVPPLGSLVNIGTHRLHVIDIGQTYNMPTVIFEHGCATSCLIWSLVYPVISKRTRTIVYDRAGYGWSEPGPMPRTNEQCVEELYNLLITIKVNKPCIFVGHSFGGINLRLFAQQYPDFVAGLIFVDATHEDEFSVRFPKEHKKQRQIETKQMWLVKNLIKLGVIPILAKFRLIPEFSNIVRKYPEDLKRLFWNITFQYNAFNAAHSEMLNIAKGYDRVRNKKLNEIPMIVLKANIFNQFAPGVTVATKEIIKQRLNEVAVDMAMLSTNGKLIVSKKSGHLIQVDEPLLVIESISELLDKYRS